MKSKKRLLKNSRLYVIIDKEACGKKSIFNTASRLKDSGTDIIQLRDKISKVKSILKQAQALRKLLLNTKIIFIINDYIDIAKIIDSDGIHLGQDDLPIKIARRLLGKDKLIGISCHNLKQAQKAEKEGADYISIGPVFPTPTKPEYKTVGLDLIKKTRKKIKLPFFAVGGINKDNINKVLSYGAKSVAVCRAVCRATNMAFTIKKLSEDISYGALYQK